MSAGNPRIQIMVTETVYGRVLAEAEANDVTMSEWIRGVLASWDGSPVAPDPREYQLSVRLDPEALARLDTLADESATTRSSAFALLIERALQPRPRPAKRKRRA